MNVFIGVICESWLGRLGIVEVFPFRWWLPKKNCVPMYIPIYSGPYHREETLDCWKLLNQNQSFNLSFLHSGRSQRQVSGSSGGPTASSSVSWELIVPLK